MALEADISNKAHGGKTFKCNPEFGKTIESEIWATYDDKSPLTLKIGNVISDIEKEVRPHFKRSQQVRQFDVFTLRFNAQITQALCGATLIFGRFAASATAIVLICLMTLPKWRDGFAWNNLYLVT